MILTVTLNASIDKLYHVKRLTPHQVIRVGQVMASAGGKGLNVARVAALAGEKVTAMGFVGGYHGQLLESLLQVRGIEKKFTHVQGETRCCINIREEQSEESTELLEPGGMVTPEEQEAFLNNFKEQLPLSDLVTVSGSLPRGVSPEIYKKLINLAQRAGKPIYFDTSGAALKAAAEAGPTLIKPNQEELLQLFGQETMNFSELAAAAEKLRQMGIEQVAVSLGKDGVLFACKEGIFHGIPPKIQVVNTVGCGDSMLAGLAVAFVRGAGIEDRIRYAVAISAANALTEETGAFRTEDLERLLGLVRVERLGKAF